MSLDLFLLKNELSSQIKSYLYPNKKLTPYVN
jgi:hypothetical protein